MRPNLQKILQAIEENFSWLHTGIREKNYQWIEDTILAIGTLRLEASIFLNRDEEVKNTNNLFFKEKIFLIQSEDPHEYHYVADKKVISQQLTGFYLLLSGIAMLIFSEREKNITHAITLASQLMKSAEKNSIENFLVLFLREGLQVNRKALATPLLFVFLNLMDRTIYQRPSDNLLPFANVFSEMIRTIPGTLSMPGVASLVSLNIYAYQREGRSAWDTLKSAIDFGNEDCFKVALVLFDIITLFSAEKIEIRDAIMQRKKIEAQKVESDCALSSSGSMSLVVHSEKSPDHEPPCHAVTFFTPVLNTVTSPVENPVTKPIRKPAAMPYRYVRAMK